jgi:hypothetical protein
VEGDCVTRFLQIEEALGKGTLSANRLREVVDARDSIIHHGGAPEFRNRGRRIVVVQEFIDEGRRANYGLRQRVKFSFVSRTK